MNAIMRKSVRGSAAGLGALAIIVGASACGTISDLAGGGDGGDDPAVEEPAEDEGAEGEGAEGAEGEGAEDEGAGAEEDGAAEDAGGESSDGGAADEETEGGEAAGGSLDQSELDAASERFVEFVQVMDDGDGEKTCSFFIDPTTDKPVEGETLTKCGEMLASQEEGLEPGSMDMIDASMVEASDNGDGTVSISMMGSEFPYPMAKADDGEWYMVLSS